MKWKCSVIKGLYCLWILSFACTYMTAHTGDKPFECSVCHAGKKAKTYSEQKNSGGIMVNFIYNFASLDQALYELGLQCLLLPIQSFKHLNIQDCQCLEKSLKIKFALKIT